MPRRCREPHKIHNPRRPCQDLDGIGLLILRCHLWRGARRPSSIIWLQTSETLIPPSRWHIPCIPFFPYQATFGTGLPHRRNRQQEAVWMPRNNMLRIADRLPSLDRCCAPISKIPLHQFCRKEKFQFSTPSHCSRSVHACLNKKQAPLLPRWRPRCVPVATRLENGRNNWLGSIEGWRENHRGNW